MLAEILAYNKSALCRSASPAFSFVLKLLGNKVNNGKGVNIQAYIFFWKRYHEEGIWKMVDPQGRINRLGKMLVRRTSLTGPVCGTQYCPVEKTPYVLITIFLLILHHYLKSTKTYLNKGNRFLCREFPSGG